MPRRLRVASGGYVYHVLNRAVGRMRIFGKERNFEAFEEVIGQAKARLPMRVLAWCVMPNHWHFVLWPRDDGDLSEFMRWLTVTHTQRWHAAHRTAGTGPLYQGRFKSFPIQEDDHLLTVLRYVERNPLRANMVKQADAWRRPNGLVWGMAVANYGHAGAWTESLGVAAPLQEMMLQSWDGALRIFSAWPKNLDARFENFRAEGAFLVSAAWSQGQVISLSLRSEKGSPCRVYSPWPKGFHVTDVSGKEIALTADPYGRPEFATQPGMEYRLQSR